MGAKLEIQVARDEDTLQLSLAALECDERRDGQDKSV
jgi:hypothetical protein